MFEKTVTIEIEVPVQFEYEPEERHGMHTFQPAAVCDLEWDDEAIAKSIIKELNSPELHGELLEHAEAEIQASKDEAKLAQWEDRQFMAECLDRR